jgi:hypothetical protein
MLLSAIFFFFFFFFAGHNGSIHSEPEAIRYVVLIHGGVPFHQ